MIKEVKLVKKVSSLLKKINCPCFLHHFGPKKYKFVQHAVALLLKETLKCSFRRISDILNQLDVRVPTYSALCKSRKRIPFWIWNNLLKITAGETSGIIAVDGTGFSRTNPSFHYIKRINAKKPVKRYAKLSALFDLVKKKFTALRVRMKPRHDMMDVKPLLHKVNKIKKLFGDSAYDAESLHEYYYWKKIQMKKYSKEEYHQRSLIESGFGSLKRKYGGSVSAKRYRGVKTEIYCKAIAHNIGLYN